jgi:hypothetical protein
MFSRECGCGADQARIIVRDELYRTICHSPFEPALGDEAIAKAGADQMLGNPVSEPAANHDRLSAVSQGQISGECPEAEAEAVERGCGKGIAALHRSGPEALLLVKG